MSGKTFHLKLNITVFRDEGDCYFDRGFPFICKSFISKYVFGKSSEFIKLWVVPEEDGNIEFHHLGGFVSFEEGQFQPVYPELTKAWEEIGKPLKASIYAEPITEQQYLDKE